MNDAVRSHRRSVLDRSPYSFCPFAHYFFKKDIYILKLGLVFLKKVW